MPSDDARFRLIVDGWATLGSRACEPPRLTFDDTVSSSTIRLKRASTIAEIRSLATGAVLDAAIGAHSGKGSGELSLWRGLADVFEPGCVFQPIVDGISG